MKLSKLQDIKLKEAKLKDVILICFRGNPGFHWDIEGFIRRRFLPENTDTIKRLIEDIINDERIDETHKTSSRTVKYNPKAKDFIDAGGYEQEFIEGLTNTEKKLKKKKVY